MNHVIRDQCYWTKPWAWKSVQILMLHGKAGCFLHNPLDRSESTLGSSFVQFLKTCLFISFVWYLMEISLSDKLETKDQTLSLSTGFQLVGLKKEFIQHK